MDEYLAAVEAELREIIVSPDPCYDAYYGMFRYHLGWTNEHFEKIDADVGKRIRPLVCLVACEALGGDWHRALPVAAAIELVHNFSLIHDDIEDNSDMRRGRAAVWKVWGLPQGLNAGDGMFVLSRLALGRMGQRGLTIQKWAAVSSEFDAATLALCRGQFLDLSFESRFDVSVDEYLQMIRGKTAALIEAAARFGAILATDDSALISTLDRFGENIGMAFQITDDILGIWGDPAITGKSAAADILSKKKSLPIIIGLNHRDISEELWTIYSQPQMHQGDVARVLALLDQIEAREQTNEIAQKFRKIAISALDETKIKNRAMDHLREIADLMTNRAR